MTQTAVDSENDTARRQFLRTVIWAGVIVFAVSVGSVVVVVTENKADALSRLVITLTPTIASAVGIVTTAILNGRLRNDQHNIKSSLATVSNKVSTVQDQTNGVLSTRIEDAVSKVLNDAGIQTKVAGKLADVLISKAAPVVLATPTPATPTPKPSSSSGPESSPAVPPNH